MKRAFMRLAAAALAVAFLLVSRTASADDSRDGGRNVIFKMGTTRTKDRKSKRHLNNDLDVACGEIVDALTKQQTMDLATEMTGNAFVALLIKYGLQVRKVCASCSDYSPLPASSFVPRDPSAFDEFCGPSSFGFDSVVSGLLILPASDDGAPTPGTFPGFIYARTSGTESYKAAPSEAWDEDRGPVLAGVLAAAAGYVAILPDYMGYGESAQSLAKSYIVRSAYQASAVPLWLETESILDVETCSNTALADAAIVTGYSEGGYAAVAIAAALDEALGIDIIVVEAGGGPYRIGSVAIPRLIKSIDDGAFPTRQLYVLALLGAAYSSTNSNLANFGKGQDMLAAESRSTIVDLVTEGPADEVVNDAIPEEDPFDIFDASFVAWARDSILKDDFDPCASGFEVGFNDKLCEALAENDLTKLLHRVEFPVKLCHSPDDEVVHVSNLPNVSMNENVEYIAVTGDHTEAGEACMERNIDYIISGIDYQITAKHDQKECTQPPSMSPTSSNRPSTHPFSQPTPSPNVGTGGGNTTTSGAVSNASSVDRLLVLMMSTFVLIFCC